MPLSLTSPGVIDPHKARERFESWKAKGCKLAVHVNDRAYALSEQNERVILAYIADLEYGVNVNPSSKKGPRSPTQLLKARTRLGKIAWCLERACGRNLLDVSPRDLAQLFTIMRSGTNGFHRGGGSFLSTGDYVKMYKAFWHWHMRLRRADGVTVPDITVDLDASSSRKPPFVYFTIDDLRKLAGNANLKMRTMMWFLFDSGIRSPTELANVRVSDIIIKDPGRVELSIRDETSKTFGRRIKLMLCAELVTSWIEHKELRPNDFLFTFNKIVVNRYLKRLGTRTFPDKSGQGVVTQGRKRFDQLTMYDFRHSACCYWLPRYKSESALKYRFGWKQSDMIHYYSEFLGMRDTISQEDLVDQHHKAELEREVERRRQHTAMLEEQFTALQHELADMRAQTASRHSADDIMDALTANPTVMRAIAGMMLDDEIAKKIRQLPR